MSTTQSETFTRQVIKRVFSSPAGSSLIALRRVKDLVGGANQSPETRPANQQRSPVARTSGVPRATVEPETSSWGGRAMLYLFFSLVLLPTFASALYFIFIASDKYLSETRLAVRAASEEKQSLSDTLSVFSKLGLSSGKASIQDSYIVLNYIKSRAIIDDIGGREYIQNFFSSGDIDYLSRMTAGKPIEDVEKYWRSHVFANMDTLSGIVTVKVFAFRADDARAIAQRIVDQSEKYVNKVSERTRMAAVSEAETEFAKSSEGLAQARASLQDFRNRSAMIDPLEKATSVGELIGKLLVQRSDIETRLATFAGSLSDSSPAVRIQKNQMEAIDQQVAELKKQLTSMDAKDISLASDLATFERLKLDEKFAEQKFSVAIMTLDKAKQEMQKQRLFLSLVVPPSMPQSALFPERGTNILLTFAAGLVLWGIICLVGASISDHVVA